MFNLIGLPLTDISQIKDSNFTLPVVALANNKSALPLVNIQTNVEPKVIQTTTEAYSTTTNLPITSTGSIVTFTINDPNLLDIKDIEIYGKKYSKSVEDNLTEGSFKLDPITRELTIYLRQRNNYNTSTAVKINGAKKKLATNIIADILPSFITNNNVTGSISISRGFQDHPSCSLNLVADAASIASIELQFNAQKYTYLFNQKFVFFNIPFRLRSFNVTISKSCESPNKEYKVQVSFEGWYRYLIDKSIKVRPGTNNNSSGGDKFTECKYNSTPKASNISLGSNTDPNKIKIGLSQLASNAGLEYAGSSYFFELDKNTPNDAVTTFSSELNKILPSKSEFPIYSFATGISTVNWNSVRSFNISESDILSECPINYNAELVTYAPGILNWKDNNTNNDKDNSEDTYKNKIPQFEYKPPKRSTVITGDSNPTVPPANLKFIQTLDMNYDQSGEKKVSITTVYEGTTVIQETTRTYGLAFNAASASSGGKIYAGANGFWKLVEETTIDHLYDTNTGYYLGNNVNGKKLVRFMQETDALETVVLADSTDAVDKAKIAAMGFRYIPVTGHTRYLLRQHKDYYKDQAFKHPYIIYPVCTSAGRIAYNQIKDPTYADDMFVGKEETYKHCFASIQNPENLGDPEVKLPALTTGEIFYSSVITNICASKSVYEAGTPTSNPIVGKDFDNPEERYITYSKQYSAQDTNFSNSLEDVNTSMVSGRPSVANRKPSDYVAVSDDTTKDPLQLNNLNGGSISTKLRETKVNSNNANKDETQYIAYSPPYNNTFPVTNSWTFEYADSLNQAIQALTTQLNIQKTQQEATLNITTFFNSYLVEGGKFNFTYLDVMYNCRILSISHSIEIQGKDQFGQLIVTGNTQLQLGIEKYSSISYFTKLIKNSDSPDNPNNTSNQVNIWNPHYVDKTLGTLIDIATTYPISRGNFRQ